MTWTWDEIDANWLGGVPIADGPEVAVEAFNRIAAVLGPGWIEGYRATHGGAGRRGPTLTLPIVTLGKQLTVIKDAVGCEGLVRRLRDNQSGARAELEAVSLLVGPSADVKLECEPKVVAAGRERKADFRVAGADDKWIYGEVTQPNLSKAEESLALAMCEVTNMAKSVEGSYAIEVFFDRSPTPEELRGVRPVLEEICRRGESTELELPDQLGRVYIGQMPGTVVLDNHGEPYTPRLGRAEVVAGGASTRHVAVRVPFVDRRAHDFLAYEAGQLPEDDPGLIMIEMSAATGGMKEWAPILREELRLDTYTNVSAICLFKFTSVGTDRGEAERVETVVLRNCSAAHQLPSWADNTLTRHEGSGSA